MTWQRLHCIECWHDMEHCATCGCHDSAPVVSTENEQRAVRLDIDDEPIRKAPAANGGRLTTTDDYEESK